jgi:ech hydrogenase subunit B
MLETLHPILRFLIGLVLFGVFAPILGCLLDGFDRKISARMQGRVGPPILQPFYDVRKLLAKERVSVNSVQDVYVGLALVFVLIAGGVFVSKGNFLLCVFVLTLATLMYIVAAYSSRSPYAEVGAAREVLQVTSYEPMVLLVAVGMYMAISFFLGEGSFDVGTLFSLDHPLVTVLPLVFVGFVFILTIKLRKSPFDLSSSHHAHQELVKGVTTEMSGSTLATVEVMHWCETVLFLMWVGMFFVWDSPASIPVAIVFALAIWFLEIWIDNNFARVKWQTMFVSAWLVAATAGIANVALFYVL